MDMSAGTMCVALIVSSVGFGFFIYGKKQRAGLQLIAGVVLMAFPYVVPSPLPMLGIATLIVGGTWAASRAGF